MTLSVTHGQRFVSFDSFQKQSSRRASITSVEVVSSNMAIRRLGNRLLNWPKLLGLYAVGFSSIFVPECVPYIIPHMFQ